MKAEIILFHM